MKPLVKVFVCLFIFISPITYCLADESKTELAIKLSNPVANLISVPFQGNYDQNIGPGENGDRYTINVQPVIPFTLSDEWNLISRTIVPIIFQDDVFPGTDQQGLGDTVQSAFFSPKLPTANGWIWGVGPVFLVPTATSKRLGSEKWGAGPTAVILKQKNGWTYGGLTNHIRSFAGKSARNDVNSTFLQPFLSYTTKNSTTIGVNTESTYDWEEEEWAVPINFSVAQLFKIGAQPMQFQIGLRNWVNSAPGGPEDWGLRMSYTLLFPK